MNLVGRLLKDEGCNPKLKDKYGLTARDYAKRKGFNEVVSLINKVLLSMKYKDQEQLDQEQKRKTWKKSQRIGTVKIEYEDEINEDIFMENLFSVCMESEEDELKDWIEQQICSEFFNPFWTSNATNTIGESWDVMRASIYGNNVETAKMLLKAGCHPSFRDVLNSFFFFFLSF